MSINNKLQKIVSLFSGISLNKKDNYYSLPTTLIKNTFIDFVEKYKGVRRTILLIVLWINIHIFFVTIEMYRKVNTVDTQWVIYAGYWTGIFATIVAFYTSGRTKEQVAKINKMQNIDEKQVDPWKFKPNDNIKVYDVDDSDNIHEGY